MRESEVVVSRSFNVRPEVLWAAITDKQKMKTWYFDLAEFKPEKGFRFEFTGGPPEKIYVHQCEVTEALPGKNLTYTWRYEGYAGVSTVSWNLTEQGETTLLTLTHRGLDTFPADNPHLAAHNFATGWDQIINHNLAAYVAGIS